MPSASLTIGQLAERTGAHIETIRYYERIALLPKAVRRGRYRSYDASDVARLGFVRRSRELGFSIKEVRTLLELASNGHDNCVAGRNLAATHLRDVRARIADLRRMERVLADTVQACDGGAEASCPLIDTLAGK